MLGERLFPLIQRFCTDGDVGKITGMMLEMDNTELLMILESEVRIFFLTFRYHALYCY